MKLAGRTALVTGGAVRIGRALVDRLLQAGVRVCVHSHRPVAEIVKLFPEAPVTRSLSEDAPVGAGSATSLCFVSADLSNPVTAARTVVAQAVQELGTIDFLINNAAIFEPGTLVTTDEASWDRQLTLNLKAPTFLCQAFAKQVPANSVGKIVNIIDWRGLRPPVGHLAYTISKAGLVALTQVLAQELAPRILVNGIAPGAILPPPGADQDHLQRITKRIPLRRTGSPADIAEALIYLLQADFVTGEILSVTGGEGL